MSRRGVSGGLHVEAVVLQASVDLVHPLLVLLDEADVEVAGVLDGGRLAGPHQREGEAIVVEQQGEVAVFLPASDALAGVGVDLSLEPEVRLEELPRLGDVGDGQMEMVEFHGTLAPLRSDLPGRPDCI